MEKPAGKFQQKIEFSQSTSMGKCTRLLVNKFICSFGKVKNLINLSTAMQFVSRKVFESQDVPLARTYRLAASKDLLDLICPCPGNIELD
jgi:hypothetical protein